MVRGLPMLLVSSVIEAGLSEASTRTSRAGSTALAIDSISPRRVRFSDAPILSG
jgi:hypothetical protein